MFLLCNCFASIAAYSAACSASFEKSVNTSNVSIKKCLISYAKEIVAGKLLKIRLYNTVINNNSITNTATPIVYVPSVPARRFHISQLPLLKNQFLFLHWLYFRR